MHHTINEFLKQIPTHIRAATWYTFIALLVVIACVLAGIYFFKAVKSAKSAIICGLLTFMAFVIVIPVALLIQKLSNNHILLSGVTYYVPYLLCASFALKKYLKCNLAETIDIVALAYLPARAVNIIGCTVSGCCQGMPAEWGLYSDILKTNVIPVQLYESVAIFVIWIVLNSMYHRKRFVQKGKCAILSIILFGALNAFTDIFTYIQPKIIYMVSMEGIFAFLTMCVGLIMLYILDKKKQTPAAKK